MWSANNTSKNDEDDRIALIPASLSVVEIKRPIYYIMENVDRIIGTCPSALTLTRPQIRSPWTDICTNFCQARPWNAAVIEIASAIRSI